jgi:glycosyltransferase involved in cell wall biosynthesis
VINDETGLLVERNPKSFAQALEKVLGEKELANRLGKNGRQHILDFWTWEHAYQRLMRTVTSNLTDISK